MNKRPLFLPIVALVLACLTACTVEKVQIPPKVAKALDLPAVPDGPDKGKVLATPDEAKAIAQDYADKLAADEAKAKKARDQKVEDAKAKADAIAAEAVRTVAKTKKSHARNLAAVLASQEDELEAIGESAATGIAEQLRLQRDADRKAADVLASIEAERSAGERALAAAAADQQAREERRLGLLNGAAGLATSTLSTVGGPWGAAGLAGLGLIGGWLGLSKPGDKTKIATSNDATRSILSAAKAAGVLPQIDRRLPDIAETPEVGLIAQLRSSDAIDTQRAIPA